MKALSLIVCTAAAVVLSAPAGQAEVPDALVAPGQIPVLTVHAEGAQVYECKADATGALVWEFREPIATLIADGKTIGRHYAGPTWELTDGSAVAAKAVARASGATAKDIPLLKLEVTSQRGSGLLSGVTIVQRLNTRGGTAEKSCGSAGSFLSVAYSADYAFLRKGRAGLAPKPD